MQPPCFSYLGISRNKFRMTLTGRLARPNDKHTRIQILDYTRHMCLRILDALVLNGWSDLLVPALEEMPLR